MDAPVSLPDAAMHITAATTVALNLRMGCQGPDLVIVELTLLHLDRGRTRISRRILYRVPAVEYPGEERCVHIFALYTLGVPISHLFCALSYLNLPGSIMP